MSTDFQNPRASARGAVKGDRIYNTGRVEIGRAYWRKHYCEPASFSGPHTKKSHYTTADKWVLRVSVFGFVFLVALLILERV